MEHGSSELEQLVRQAKRGSAQAFSVLYKRVYTDLYRVAFYTMKQQQDAEDAVSEAVMKAFEKIPTLKKAQAFRSWMFQILINCCRKKMQQRSRMGPEWEDEQMSGEEVGSHPTSELSLSLWEALEILSDEERMIIALSVFGGYTSREIGAQMNLPAATVRSKLRRSLQKMKDFLGEEENR